MKNYKNLFRIVAVTVLVVMSYTATVQAQFFASRKTFNSIGILGGIKLLPSKKANKIGSKTPLPICGSIYYERFFTNYIGAQLGYDGCYGSISKQNSVTTGYNSLTQFGNDLVLNVVLGLPIDQSLLEKLEVGLLAGGGASILLYENTDVANVTRKDTLIGAVANVGAYIDAGSEVFGVVLAVKGKMYFYPKPKNTLKDVFTAKEINDSQLSLLAELGIRYSF